MDGLSIQERLMRMIIVILCLSVHEWAHAISAFWLGDTTARDQGRMTLNPLAHIDLFGTVLLPLSGIPFGWARPVPFNPTRFRRGINMRTGTMITKAAGPLSNATMALVCAVVLGFMARSRGEGASDGPLQALVIAMIQVNVGLAIFNFLPMEPLDGAGVLDRFIPDALRPGWDAFRSVSPYILMGLLILSNFGPGGGLLMTVLGPPMHLLTGLVRWVANAAAGAG